MSSILRRTGVMIIWGARGMRIAVQLVRKDATKGVELNWLVPGLTYRLSGALM